MKKSTLKKKKGRTPKRTHRFAWTAPITALSSTLGTLEDQVARGDPITPGLEHFKSALDELRLRAWGLLMATAADDPRGFQAHFRILRGRDMCRALIADLETGKLSGRQPELPELGTVATDLATTVERVRARHPAV
jgi:hypothetical protein